MPGYGKRSMYAAPEPTEEVDTVEKRFVMPKFTWVQIAIILTVIIYAVSMRKMNPVLVTLGTFGVSLSLLHLYDHFYLLQRGSERLFFLPKKEEYGCQMCK